VRLSRIPQPRVRRRRTRAGEGEGGRKAGEDQWEEGCVEKAESSQVFGDGKVKGGREGRREGRSGGGRGGGRACRQEGGNGSWKERKALRARERNARGERKKEGCVLYVRASISVCMYVCTCLCMHVCVCVCACERKRKNESRRERRYVKKNRRDDDEQHENQ